MERERVARDVRALCKTAHVHRTQPRYFDRVACLTEKRREQVVKYINELAEDFALQVETASRAVNYFDRYCSQKPDMKASSVQIVASTALLIASKFVDRKLPPLSELVKVHHHTVRAEEFAATELDILSVLRWDLNVLLPLVFYEKMAPLHRVDAASELRARFFMDLSVYDCTMLEYSPSTIAAAALLLSSAPKSASCGAIMMEACDPAEARACAFALSSYYDRAFPQQQHANENGPPS